MLLVLSSLHCESASPRLLPLRRESVRGAPWILRWWKEAASLLLAMSNLHCEQASPKLSRLRQELAQQTL